MELLQREDLDSITLPGRVIQKAVGRDSAVDSNKMTMGFGHYSSKSGPMEPHHHAEEICYVLGAEKSWVRFGTTKLKLTNKINLKTGMTLHIPDMEFHVFEFLEEGFVDLIFFYGQVEGIRPEERE
ncbi:MAG: hypothetical protein K6T88_05470 [Bacillus sp. (in: Bacteria)]|nr:hypothetical protein [Bacillus sp. (in: firmicutes)]